MPKVVRCTIQNRETVLTRPYPEKIIDELTSFNVPGAFFMPSFRRWHKVIKTVNGQRREVMERVWDGKSHLLKRDTLPTGLFLAVVVPELKKLGYRIVADDRREFAFSPPRFSVLGPFGPSAAIQKEFPDVRPFQIQQVLEMMKAQRTGGIVLSATGSGKTYTAGVFFKIAETAQCLFVVDELTLLHQAQKELKKVIGEEVGIVGEGIFLPQRVTVATIQTLWKHSEEEDKAFQEWFDSIRIVVIDEIHVQMNRRNFGIVEAIGAHAVYGLTATLRLGKKDVRLRAYSIAGPVIYTYPLEKGVEQKFLARVVAVRIPFRGDQPTSRAFKTMAKYTQDYDDLIVMSVRRNNVVEKLVRLCIPDMRRVIVLAERVKHLKVLFRRLKDLNPRLVYGEVKSGDRQLVVQGVATGDVRLVITNRVFQKGVNIPTADTGIDASALTSKNSAIQRAGRLARLAKGKRWALYFDISDFGNRFEKPARSRLAAYREARIPILKMTRSDQYESIKQEAERLSS